MDLLENWFESIRNGNLKEISAIYKSNPDYINKFTTINDGRNCYQTNAIIEASFQGNRDLVKWLIDNNADVNSTSDGGWRPIHFAAQHGHVTTVNLLVLGGADVNVETDAKETPILFALQAYMRDTVKKLLHHGASLVGIDRDYLQMCIQKDILDPGFLDDANKSYLADSGSYRKIDSNGYDLINRQHHERDIDEIKPIKLQKTKVISEYDNELKRRRQELLKKMRRSNEPLNSLVPLVRKIAQCEHDQERIGLVRELLEMIETQEGIVPQTKFSDQMINMFELCLCDSDCTDELIVLTGRLMMAILHRNIRRGDDAVVEFWCRIFDKMTNLQIEQYTYQILKMLFHMLDNAPDGVVAYLTANRDSFLQNWEYFFENLCFPKCLNLSLMILKKIHSHCPDSVVERFHNVIDIMIGWCIHPDTDPVTMAALCERSVDLHECWLADPLNLKKTLSNLQKDIFTHCQMLARIHRIDKDRNQVDELKLKIKFFCFALSCVTAGISQLADVTKVDFQALDKHRDPKVAVSVATVITTPFVLGIIEKLTEGLILCSKQIDFDNLLLQANTAILQLLSIVTASPDPTGSVFPMVMKYVFGSSIPLQTHLVSDPNYQNRELLGTYLDLIGICLTKIFLEPATVIQLMSPVNWIHSCIFYGSVADPWLLEKYLRLVDVVARSPCVPTFYQILLSDLELALNSLLKAVPSSAGTTGTWRLVQTNAFKSKSYEPSQAELVVKYNVSLIVLLHDRLAPDAVGLLVPSVPVLFTRYLLFQDAGAVAAFPVLAVFVMDTVAKQLDVARPDFQLAEFVRYLCLVIGSTQIDFEARYRAFRALVTAIDESPHRTKWDAMLTDNRTELANQVLGALVDLAGRHSSDSETLVLDCLAITRRVLLPSLLQNQSTNRFQISDRNLGRLTDLCVRLSQHPCHKIRCVSVDIYFELLLSTTMTTATVTMSTCSDAFKRDIKSIQSIASAGRAFKFPTDFSKSIFQWIVESTERQSFSSREFLRLNDLVTSTTAATNNRLMMVHQVIINVCWDCVRQKLKFDRNADSRTTLLGIENTVRAVLTNGRSLRDLPDQRFRTLMGGFTNKAPEDQALSVSLLLVLLEVLEKLFYNAYEGCCIGFPGVSKATETFFMTNRQVCVDWFAKMRLFVIALAQYSGQWSTVVWHGMQLLQANLDRGDRVLTTEIEDCIVLTAMALSKLGSWESLVGLSHATLAVYGSKFEWVDALVDKTRGQLEQATDKFEAYLRTHHDPETRATRAASEMRLLTRKQSNSHSSFILVMEELADCHRLLGNVTQIESWKRQLTTWRADPQMPQATKSAINWDRLACLTKLSQWNNNIRDNNDGDGKQEDRSSDFDPLRSKDVSWKYRSVLDRAEDQLFLSLFEYDPSTAISPHDNPILKNTKRLVSGLASTQSVCDYPGSFSNPDIVLLYERLRLLKLPARDPHPIDCKSLSRFSPTLPLGVIGFSNALHNASRVPLAHTFPSQLYLIQWHRKNRNFEQCQSLVSSCFSVFLGRDPSSLLSGTTVLSLGNSLSPIVQMQLERELVKLLWHQDRRPEALTLLTNSLRDSLLFETSDPSLHSAKCRINTKSLLTLFRWLCADKHVVAGLLTREPRVSANLQFLIELVEVPWINGLPLLSPQQRAQQRSCAAPITDVCSQLLILASKSHDHDTRTDKSFMTLAQWCLTRSRSLDRAGFIADGATARQLSRTLEVEHHLSRDTADNAVLLLRTNFCPTRLKTELDWFGDCVEDTRFVDELRDSVMALDPDMTAAACDLVLRCWADFLEQHFSLHVAAADAYFSFLKDAPAATPRGHDKNKTTANLRILSLLGKRSRVLRQSIVAKIRTSPPSAWTSVIPQLFARLKHSDPSITGCMAELLERLATSNDSCRNLIIYPTLVGAINETDNPGSPYHDIKKVLVDSNRPLVDQVSVFIKELRRITVLWDELWVSSLGQCYDELNKKVHQLQSEIEKIDDPGQQHLQNRETILQLKYSSIIQPAIFILDRTQAATSSVPPITPRECWFNNLFAEEIANTINQVKSPIDIREFNDAWKKIKDLQELIMTESNNNHIRIKQKRGRHHFMSLKLAEISPGLLRIAASQIPLPGMIDKQLVSIESDISILPTKTKPKKFRFLASDGRRYNYLYKGLEDLRLDERIMQVLDIANTMFGSSATVGDCNRHKYWVTTYPVTPLGTRAGLIQMVDEATSLFSLYKRHQIRNKTASLELHKSRQHRTAPLAAMTIGPQAGTASTTDATGVSEEGHPIRPTDIFWQKLRPKLEAAKIDVSIDNRDKWPLPLLVEVLTELSRETPADLLSKELWLCSINTRNWFESSLNFTRSSAVMSVLGHVLGLGDRHLDNLLVNFSTGQMVHIDYNVCFDKGTSLKVPEKVPFRLTEIITNVFGPASVDGLFRISCEQVYELIGQCQDSILTLMDTFVLDPIVDWASGTEAGHYGSFDGGRFATSTPASVVDKRSVEFTIQLTQFQAVLVAMESECRTGRDKILELFRALHSSLASSLEVGVSTESTRRERDNKRKIIDYLRGYQGDDIVERIRSVRRLEDRAAHLDIDIANRAQQLKTVVIDHSGFFNTILSTTDFITIKLEMSTLRQFFEEQLAIIDKSSLLLSDRYPPESKAAYLALVARLTGKLDTVNKLQDCVQVLSKYRAVVQEMPQSYFTSDRCNFMADICDRLVREHPNVNNLSEELTRYKDRWTSTKLESEESIVDPSPFFVEKANWSALLKLETERIQELTAKVPGQGAAHDEEIQELEHIWQLTMFENVAGMHLFKAALLEQYLEMAQVTAQLDSTVITKIPDPVSLSCDYNATLRKYLQLVNAHENYFKILVNSMSMFGIYINTGEVVIVCQMMSALQKCCVQALTFESNFIDIILPESMKIMRQLSSEDTVLLEELRALIRQGDQVMLHFNIATTSTVYDAKHYEHIHHSVVTPLRERLAQLTNLSPVTTSSSGSTGPRQLRILLASFSATLLHTQQLACEFIDCCMSSSTPSSWSFIDLVAASSLTISPIWNKSITLLKDALFVSGLRFLGYTLDQHAELLQLLAHSPSPSAVAPAVDNVLRQLELYFNFIGRHVIAGVASQCFGKMFCVLLEHAGWNIDALIAESGTGSSVVATAAPGVVSGGSVTVPLGHQSVGGTQHSSPSVLNAEFICNSVLSFRKTEYGGAPHFYEQLQFRFSRYRGLTGIGSTVSMFCGAESPRFLQRNLGLHKALSALARNQLLSRCWTERHMLRPDDADHDDPDLAPVIELARLVEGIPERLALLRELQHEIDVVSTGLTAIDEEMMITMTSVLAVATSTSSDSTKSAGSGSAIISTDRFQALARLRKRVALVIDVMLNIDRFESLRTGSVRAAQFDREVLDLLSSSRDLLETLAESSRALVPLETDIVSLTEHHGFVDDIDWCPRILTILETEVAGTDATLHEQDRLMGEVISRIENDGRLLKTRLGTEYYALLGAVKPSLRVLHSAARKLRVQLALLPAASDSSDNSGNVTQIRERVDQVLTLMSLIERFSGSVDSLVQFMVTGNIDKDGSFSGCSADFVKQLEAQLAAVTLLKDSVVPELFDTLACLSPLSVCNNEVDEQQKTPKTTDKQIALRSTASSSSSTSSMSSKFRFSSTVTTNNVPEINSNGEVCHQLISTEEDIVTTVVTNKALVSTTMVGSSNMSANAARPESRIIDKPVSVTTVTKVPVTDTTPVSNNHPMLTTGHNVATNGGYNVTNNNAGVQKAIEVWKLIESRLNSTTGGVGADTSSISSVPAEDGEVKPNSTSLSQYVDKLIKAARSPENLARMYEGWTAWV